MTEVTFYARGDSSTANNSSINSVGTTTVPVTQLTFTSGSGGDIVLDYAGGSHDPDTWVVVNGVTMTFTLEFSGTLSSINKLSNVAGVDMRGAPVTVITTSDGQRFYFITDGSGTPTVMQAMPNGALPINNVNSTTPVLICFVQDTVIATPEGEVAVQNLTVGQLVLTLDHGPQPLRWIGCRRLSLAELMLYPALRPVILARDSFGPGLPHSDLGLSPQHRVVVGGWATQLLFGLDQALSPARHLAPARLPDGPVNYYHLLFDRHEIVLSNGLATESFQPGLRGLSAMDAATRDEIFQLFPGLRGSDRRHRPDGRPALSGAEARVLRRYLPA